MGDVSAVSQREMTTPYLSIEAVASQLAVSTMTVRRIVHRGDLPAVRVGERQFRVAVSDFESYLERQRVDGAAA